MSLKKENILIVDDNFDMLEVLQRNLKSWNFHTYKASSVIEAMNILKYSTIDLLITDLQMPEINGMELIKYVEEHFPNIPKLVITGYPSVDGAIDAVKSGALDYLVKPFTTAELKQAVERSLQNRDTKSIKKDTAATSSSTVYAGIVGQSEQIEQLIDVIERVKNNRATVLIQGECGT
ncbi:MAG TPA: response regulator [Gillisia sp.]|nr:response regulator [Gillisia sp.]